ncbi:unnamed protein product [Prunus brigantina]
MMTPNLLDLAAIINLSPHRDDFSTANHPDAKFLACPRSSGITKEFQALVEVLVDGYQVSMGPIFLAYLYIGLNENIKTAEKSLAVKKPTANFAPCIIVNPSAEDGRGLAVVAHEGALLPLPDQLFGHIFDFLNQWDASISLVEASTHIATSSTTVGPYQIPGLRHYFGHIVMETS